MRNHIPTAALRAGLFAAGIAILAALPYIAAGVGPNFIAFDDGPYVTQNPHVTAGLARDGLRWAFTTFHTGNWHPLTWLSHQIDAHLFGLDARGHHFTSILLHALNAALLFLALARITGRTGPAALVAALFGVHPLHVESVAWVAERKDVLAGLLFVLVLLAYERYVRRGGMARYLLVAALLALGLMAKPTLVTVPFLLLLLDVWPLGRASLPRFGTGRGTVGWGRLLIEKVPLLALSAASSAVTLAAQRNEGSLADLASYPLAVRLANAVVSLAAYLGKTLWPAALAVYYPHPQSTIPLWQIAGSLALLAALSALALAGARRRPWLLAGWCWYLGLLVPMIGIVQVGGQAMADRHTYLPLCGLFLAAAWSLPGPEAVQRLRGAAAVAVLIVAMLTVTAALQAARWRDSETLFRHALAVTEDNWLVQNNLGLVLAERGSFEEAAEHYREALRIRAEYFDAHGNLGYLLMRLGRGDEALVHFRESVRLRPDSPEALTNLGAALAAKGRPGEAIERYREAIRLRPDSANTHNNLGNALAATGELGEAIESYREAIRLRPDYANAHNNLGNALARGGRFKEAIASYREVLRLRPDSPETRRALSILLQAMGSEAAESQRQQGGAAGRP